MSRVLFLMNFYDLILIGAYHKTSNTVINSRILSKWKRN